jgi:hypothetical protein
MVIVEVFEFPLGSTARALTLCPPVVKVEVNTKGLTVSFPVTMLSIESSTYAIPDASVALTEIVTVWFDGKELFWTGEVILTVGGVVSGDCDCAGEGVGFLAGAGVGVVASVFPSSPTKYVGSMLSAAPECGRPGFPPFVW